ncbi:MAG: hypothetical protein AAFX53_19235 [Bacteroidota bacterium]
MKPKFPPGLFILLFFLIPIGCEKEEISQTVELQEAEPPSYTTATVGEAEIAGLLAELEGETGKNALLSPSADKKKRRFRLDRKRAVKVTDSAGNRTFAMTIWSEDPSPYHIYNLIVPKRKKGRMASFIIRYGLAYGDTPGSASIFSLKEFTNGVHLEGRNGPVPCYEAQQTVPTATNGGAAGNSTGYNNPFAPAINGYYTGPSVRLTVDIPFNRPNTRVIGGDGSFTWSLGYIPVGKTSLSTGPDWEDPIRQDDDEKRATGQKTGKAGDCPEGELLLPIDSSSDDILLVPSCQSFEYADGKLVKAAGVSNVQNVFIAAGVDNNGPFYHSYHLNITKAYFSMPKYWTNGKAANVTANALRAANINTKEWFLKNPKATSFALGLQWEKNIRSSMRAIGGDFSKTPPFPIRNLAPYAEDWAWDITDCG